jgi:hypothetical protein
MVDDLGRKTFRALAISRISKTSGYSGGQQPNQSGEIPGNGRLQRMTLLGKIGDTCLMGVRMACSLSLCHLDGGSMLEIHQRSQRLMTLSRMLPGCSIILSLASPISPHPTHQKALLLPSPHNGNVPGRSRMAFHQSVFVRRGIRFPKVSHFPILSTLYKYCC